MGIDKQHRDYLGFLWFDDVNSWNPKVIIPLVIIIISSPFLLNRTIKLHVNTLKAFVYKFLENLYVDDLTVGFHSVEESYAFFINSKS